MSDFMRDTGTATAEGPSASEYRIREVEARLERRLAALEARRKQSRWAARVAGVGAVVMLAALAYVLWTVAPGDGAWLVDSVSTEELVLRDGDGVARGHLATDAEGRTRLTLSDRDGRERIQLTVLADGSPGITISDPDERPRAILAYLPDGTTNLVLADGQGVSRAVFGLDPDGSTQAVFSDGSGTTRTLVGVGASGEPSVSVFEGGADEDGRAR